ncbi:hypothetical protein B5807_10797 [Epicoccum nigrum]|uniref:Fungal lipase-like domain-containing protein n=1 Tax=Epicoccum nigrum TaxID=105696 RepID=A0A1Y2LL48_EPING|nr:hypothetical protein B5807_10797 [Epicoccum nigrum]
MLRFASFVLSVLLFALLSNAAPFLAEKRAIDDNLFQSLKLMAQYASAAYCPDVYTAATTTIKCGSGNCPQVESANASTTLEYSRTETLTDVTGFVATDPTNKLIVVSFRGSISLSNWLTNLDFALTDTALCSGCLAHTGFWNSWQDASAAVLPALRLAKAQHPSYRIAVTGHSLGGAVATLAAAAMRQLGYPVALYSFGAPRVGGPKLSSFISTQHGGNYRVTHWNDPVPRVPLVAMGG